MPRVRESVENKIGEQENLPCPDNYDNMGIYGEGEPWGVKAIGTEVGSSLLA